ncbi:MAG: PIN domain-containing protein [Blastomonas sp.]
MACLLDTNIVIHLRDGDSEIIDRLAELAPPLAIAIISRVELENGVYRDPRWTSTRRTALDLVLSEVATIDFGEEELHAYQGIVRDKGYSRRKTVDRMIAATALAHGLSLVTMNAGDFADIDGLQILDWASQD